EICSKQPWGYSGITGNPAILGSQGEVEIVVLNLPRPCLHSSGITRCASNCGPVNEPATLSLRTIVGGSTRSVISTASDILLLDFDTASKRIFAWARSTSATFALNRNTVGASRCADCVALSPPSNFKFASVIQRAVISSLSAKFSRTTAR